MAWRHACKRCRDAGAYLVVTSEATLEGGHPEHLGDRGPRTEDERGAVDGGHAERLLDLGVGVGEGGAHLTLPMLGLCIWTMPFILL